MEKEPLDVKYINYKDNNRSGFSFVINNINFNWKDLKSFSKLEEIMGNLKNQYHYKTRDFAKPTNLLRNNYTNENILYEEKNILTMNICLPCYDEEWCEISGTLRSISKNILVHRKRPDHSFQLHVNIFIIQDGWNRATDSLKEGIYDDFGCPSKDWITNNLNNNSISIIIPDSELYYPAYEEEYEQSGVTFNPIFITKYRNAQKHNSHLIFFSLCHLQNPTFVFLTDCGTIFDADCIYLLVEYLYKKHDNVIGVTAKQRVMNHKIMRQIHEYPYWYKKKRKTSFCNRFFKQILWWFSPAPLQGFEFESTFLLNTSMFNIVGALPVLPGPCQLLWWSHLQVNEDYDMENSILDVYFKHLNMDIEKSGIIKVNTILAEDRILSFAMVLRTFDLKTVWVKDAVFNYEPMMSWVKLLGQRRRWINGTISTFLYYLLDDKGIDEFLMSGLANNKSIKILWFIQLYQSILQIFSPSFFCIAVFESVLEIIKKYPILNTILPHYKIPKINYIISPEILITSLYFGFYISWVFISIVFGNKSKCCSKCCYNFFMESIYLFFSFINSIISILIFFTLFTNTAYNSMILGPLFYFLIIIWVVPLFLSLFLSFSSCFLFILYSLPFFINICQYVCFIPSFALARIHDLSWGNRDSENYVNRNTLYKYFMKTLKVNFSVIFSNLIILGLYIYLLELFGRNEYVYLPLFFCIFLSVIIQIFFTLIYFFKILFKGCYKNNNKNFDEIGSNGSGSVVTIPKNNII